jgi:decaprenylphospho-beta-D-ribofuranose 2-oxidase
MKKVNLTNFARNTQQWHQLTEPYFITDCKKNSFLFDFKPSILGAGCSYNDCFLSPESTLISTSHLSRFIEKKADTIRVESGVTFEALLAFNSTVFPCVIPGTLYATIGGAIAHDVHGKNNVHFGTLGASIHSFTLFVNNSIYFVSKDNESDLFYATIAGMGLTGMILDVTLKVQHRSHLLNVNECVIKDIDTLLNTFIQNKHHDYQMAWLDLSQPNFFKYTYANHCEITIQPHNSRKQIKIPNYLSLNAVNTLTVYLFNKIIRALPLKNNHITTFQRFNNPLDAIHGWQYIYGNKGFYQFQGLFSEEQADRDLNAIIRIIQNYRALPVLAVLKYFEKPGVGLMTFARKGFTLAIDFPNNATSIACIQALNTYIIEAQGNIYLAKDSFLTNHQCEQLYPNYAVFKNILKRLDFPHQTQLSKRLGLT